MPELPIEIIEIPDYEVNEVVGRGAMSIVYRAVHVATGIEKAVKMLRTEHLERKDLRQRFAREADLSARISHPNIVHVEYYGEYEGAPYMVMPLLDPVTLGDKLETTGHFSVSESLECIIQILEALVVLHRENVIHRDLKAENILLSTDGRPLISDLGLAFSQYDSRITSIGTGPLGTPQYMAPEQWMGHAGDRRTDIFACGVLLFHMLTGAFPIAASTPKEVMAHFLKTHTPAPLPETILPANLRDSLQSIIHKALSVEADERYQTATEMKQALKKLWKPNSEQNSFSNTEQTNPGLLTLSYHGKAQESQINKNSHVFAPYVEEDDPSSDFNFDNLDLNSVEVGKLDAETIAQEVTPSHLNELSFTDETEQVEMTFDEKTPLKTTSAAKPSGGKRASQLGEAATAVDSQPTSDPLAPRRKKTITQQISNHHKGTEPMQHLNDELNPQKLAINPIEIAPGSYWVGKRTPGDFFFANPFLRTFKGNNEEFNLIIDPGSSSDFSIVQAKCSRIIGNLSKINAAFINHQDPDVGSSVGPLIGRYSPGAYCLCTEDTWRLIQYYNIPRERFVPLEKYPNGFRLPTGHKLIPVPSPFCHFVGAMMIYDPETCVLYSGDLFGGLTDKNAKGLWADESDWVGMRAFHQIYMPTRGALINAIKNIRSIKGEVKIIAPQHGRLLAGDIMHQFMERLENLSCGLDILSDRQATPDELLAWTTVLQRILKRASDFTTEDLYQLILENNSLEGLISETDSGIEIKKMGKYTIEQVLRTICDKLNDKDIEGMIKYEAAFATSELGLPTPNMDIDEGDAPHSKGSMLGNLVD